MTISVDLSNVRAEDLLEELYTRLTAEDHGYRISHDDVIATVWPLGGPYSGEDTEAAGGAISELVRYLNHATYHQAAAPYLSTMDSLIGRLAAATTGMKQTLAQLATLMGSEANRASVYEARQRDDATLAVNNLEDWQRAVRTAAQYANHLGAMLAACQRSGLGNRTNVDNQLIDREGNPV
jgi:hypothetical protein